MTHPEKLEGLEAFFSFFRLLHTGRVYRIMARYSSDDASGVYEKEELYEFRMS